MGNRRSVTLADQAAGIVESHQIADIRDQKRDGERREVVGSLASTAPGQDRVAPCKWSNVTASPSGAAEGVGVAERTAECYLRAVTSATRHREVSGAGIDASTAPVGAFGLRSRDCRRP